MSKILTFVFSAVLSVLVVWVAVSGATTISTNVSTGGTLSVTGQSTLTGGFLSNASSTVASTFSVQGNLSASSTAQFASLVTLTGGFVSQASSSVSSSLEVMSLGVASSSVVMEVNVDGGAGTSSIRALSATTARGGCIELGVPAGGSVRIYATSTTALNGTANGGIVVESGHCE